MAAPNVAELLARIELLESKMEMQRNLKESFYGMTSAYTLNSGDTAWMLTSTALVLFMAIPGLALYYAGLTRTKHVLSVFAQVFTICCLITFLWLCFGYSLSFGAALPVPYANGNQIIGDASRFWLRGLHYDSYHQLANTIPEAIFCMYQLTFAIITPALIVGSISDRMKFHVLMIFVTVWHLAAYCPIAHSCWHPEGFLKKAGDLDYAGGNVVHIASGVAGLVAAVLLGKRKGFGKEVFDPHNVMFSVIGACMLWVGWFGFNAGSAVTAGMSAGMAMLVTHISAAVGGLSWLITEWIITGQPKLTAVANGAVSGLVAITPACGYVDANGAFWIGFFAGPACFGGAKLKHYFGYDDALDAFGVHAIGGFTGSILAGLFATSGAQGPGGISGWFYDSGKGGHQLGIQIYASVVVAGWSAFVTLITLKFLDLVMGLRVLEKHEDEGLDSSLHGESLTMDGSARGERALEIKEVSVRSKNGMMKVHTEEVVAVQADNDLVTDV